MTTETLLVKTKDNYVVAINVEFESAEQKAQIQRECENHFTNISYKDLNNSGFAVSGATVDGNNTDFINREITGYHHIKNPAGYRNGLQEKFLENPKGFPKMFINDADIPPVIKNLGFEISADVKEYKVDYDDATGEYVFTPEFNKTIAYVVTDNIHMSVLRNKFVFDNATKAEIENLIRDFKRSGKELADFKNNLNPKQQKLFAIYEGEQKVWSHMRNTVNHELKHVANGLFADGLSLKKDVKRLSVEDCYRLAVEDERSAYFGQIINSFNAYLKKGDFNDYSMFDGEGAIFVADLKQLSSDEERKKYATDYEKLLPKLLESFEKHHQASYDKTQFLFTTRGYAKMQPKTAPEDTNHAYFKRLQNLFYHYEVYDPDSGRMKHLNVAKYIDAAHEVKITDEVRRDIISDVQSTMNHDIEDVQNKINEGTYNPALLAPARQLMHSSLQSSEMISRIDNLRVSSIIDEEITEPAAPVADDHAEWSDALQQYWSQQTGYQEVAKNNDEYSFKINDHAVRYTAPNKVNLSPTADYDLYEKLLQEPSNKDRPVEFMPSLSPEQALMLYVACINCGRQPVGANVPQDLSLINNLRGIPPQALNRFNAARGQNDQRGENNHNGENEGSRADTSSENNQQTDAENMQHIAHVRERIENNAGHNRHKQPTATPPTGRRAPLNPIMARMLASRARKM